LIDEGVRPTFALPRKPSARNSMSIALGAATALAPDETCVKSIDVCATSPETRKRPPKFLDGSVTRTGKLLTDAAMENIGLKNKSFDFPHTPSMNCEQIPGAEQNPTPDAAEGIATNCEEFVFVCK